jgi:hypothetical protein
MRRLTTIGSPLTSIRLAMPSIQRKPKYPRMNRTMTTAPTNQISLFMIEIL